MMKNLMWIVFLLEATNFVHGNLFSEKSASTDDDCFVPSKSPLRRSNDDPPSVNKGPDTSTPRPSKCPSPSPTKSATVTGIVWSDSNNDGIQDTPTEPGEGGVTVNLLDCEGNLLHSTTTSNVFGNEGKYSFEGVSPGCTVVDFDLPPGFIFTVPDQGGDPNNNSDPDSTSGQTPEIILVPGGNVKVDAGVIPKTTVVGIAFSDSNQNGIQDPDEPGVEDVTVNLLDCDGNLLQTTTTSNAIGNEGAYAFEDITPGCVAVEFIPPPFMFTVPSEPNDPGPGTGKTQINPPPGQFEVDLGLLEFAIVNGFIWNDIDADGNQDPNEPGIDGVDVVLLNCDGDLLQSATTNGGTYSFQGVTPGCISVGIVGPEDFVFPEEGGNPELDINRDENVGISPDKVLLPGENYEVDVGFIRSGALSGFVWEDKNRNGIQDSNEPEFVDVTVNLFNCNDDEQPVQSTTTTASGMFSFEDVKPSCYFYKFDAPDMWGFSPSNSGSDDEIDSDADSTGKTPSVTLVQGGELSMDAGLQCLGDGRTSKIYSVLQTVSAKSDLDDISTPQGKAYQWIVKDDPLLLCPGFGTNCQFIQRYVLAVFYFSTSGDDWLFCGANEATPCEMNPNPDQTCRVTTRWLSSDNECDWCGNTCNPDFCLTEIQIERNNQNGLIPNEISELLNVTHIRLENGKLNGKIPETIQELHKLKFLDLDYQELTGSIPDGLWEMTKMEQLDLNNNMLTGTIDSRIGNFHDLDFLQLYNNNFVGTIPDVFSKLTKLRAAQFEGNELTGSMPASLCQHRSNVAPFADDALIRLRADCAGDNPSVACSTDSCCSFCSTGN